MRQILFLCYLLLLLQILPAVKADDPPTLTWLPSFPYATEECPTPTEWENKCKYDLSPQFPGVSFEYKQISHLIGTADLYEVLIEFELDNHYGTLTTYGAREISFNNLQTPDNYLTPKKIALNQELDEISDSRFHFFVKWVMQAEAHGQSMCTTPFMIEYVWRITDVRSQIFHDCDLGHYPLQCWTPVCSGSETESKEEETTLENDTSKVKTSEQGPSAEPTITAPPGTLVTFNEMLPTANSDCLTTWEERCSAPPVETDGFSPSMKKFEFVEINSIIDDYYEVLIEIEITSSIFPVSSLEYIALKDLISPDNYLSNPFRIYDRSLSENVLGESPYHFFVRWAMKTQTIDDLVCTTPFSIEFSWKGGVQPAQGRSSSSFKLSFIHDCESEDPHDYPLQCWPKECVEPEPENTEPGPVTIEPEKPDLPEPLNCPEVWTDDYACNVTMGDHAKSKSYPEVLAFEFKSIKFINENLYKVVVEFQIDSRVHSIKYLERVRIMLEHSAYGYNNGRVTIYERSSSSNLAADSPYHFYFVYVMRTQSVGSFTCTSSFSIDYYWKDSTVVSYHHGCSGADSPLQCWEDECHAELDPSTIPTTRDDLTSTKDSPPIPSTVISTLDDLPSPTACPIEFGLSECTFDVGDSSRSNMFPSVLKFDFISIEWVEDDSYEVMIEFEIENTMPIDILRKINILGLQTPGYYLPFYFEIYSDLNPENTVGDSPYHFFFKWVATAELMHNTVCTTPFHISYRWDNEFGEYGHGCPWQIANADSPLQCWEDLCTPETTRIPSTIIATDERLPQATECNYKNTDSCSVGHLSGVKTFNFVHIKSIEDNLYEVMLEFEIRTIHPKSSVRSISVTGIPDQYHDLLLYDYDGVDQVGDSAFHFFLVWVMEVASDGTRNCTTPFSIQYNWSSGVHQEFNHGCNYWDEYAIQCWDEVCTAPEETTTTVQEETTTEPEEEIITEQELETTIEPDETATTVPEETTTEAEETTTEAEETTTVPDETTTEPDKLSTQRDETTTGLENATTTEPEEESIAEPANEITTQPEVEPTTNTEGESSLGLKEPSDPPTESFTENPTAPPTNEGSTITVSETAVEPPTFVTRTVTETVTSTYDSTSRVFTETVTYTTIDPPLVTRTLTETIIRTDADPITTRIFTETVTYTTADPPPDTRTLTDTITTVVIDPDSPTNSITLTLTVTITSVRTPSNPTGTSPTPPPVTPGTEMRITITNLGTTYITTITESYSPLVVVTTISNPDTTYVTTITEPYNPPFVGMVPGLDNTYATTITQQYNPLVVTTISEVDTTYVTTISYPAGFPATPPGPQSSNIYSNPNGLVNPNDPYVASNPSDPNSLADPNIPVSNQEPEEELRVSSSGTDSNYQADPNPVSAGGPVSNPNQDEELQAPYSGGEPNSPVNPNNPNAWFDTDMADGNPGQEEELQVQYGGSTPNPPVSPNDYNAPNPNYPSSSLNQEEEEVQYSVSDPNASTNPNDPNGANSNDSASNSDQYEELQVPEYGGKPNVDSGNPTVGSDPNALVYTSADATTFVYDRITYASSAPVVYATSVPAAVPEVMLVSTSSAAGSNEDGFDTDPNFEEMLEDFLGSASNLKSNSFILFLCLISMMMFV
ncbi:hypothetical protein JA1_000062 [Spathaspora sp. JA1]|nr:hypothetical protein JA1_000062 [Spathaspora sp. JA1]